ncbi:MAG: hypothetical protein ACKO04_02595 [Actinomycetes bacterium]
MRTVRLVGFAVLALAALGIYFVPPSRTGSDPRIVALLALLVVVVAWHFATLRRSRHTPAPVPVVGTPVAAPAPLPEDVVEREVPVATAPPVPPGAITPTEVLPPDAEVVAQGPATDQFDLDAPVPGAPVAADPAPAGPGGPPPGEDAASSSDDGPALPPPPPEPQYKDGFEKWAAEMFGPGPS